MRGTAPSSAMAGSRSKGTAVTPTRRVPPWASADAVGQDTTRSDATAQSHMRMNLLYTKATIHGGSAEIWRRHDVTRQRSSGKRAVSGRISAPGSLAACKRNGTGLAVSIAVNRPRATHDRWEEL